MSVTIELTPTLEAQLSAVARMKGIDRSELIQEMIRDYLPKTDLATPVRPESGDTHPVVDAENAAAIALLDSWLLQDATDDPEELLQAQQEFQELKRNLNANRNASDERSVFP